VSNTIYRIEAAIQPRPRAKWVKRVVDFGEQGTEEMTLQQAWQQARQLMTALEQDYPAYVSEEYGPVYMPYFEVKS
jgi:hypothetical protein